MTTRHTKGEWYAIRPEGSNGFYYVKSDIEALGINTATCHNPSGAHEDEEEVEANAKLIAAAPELLEALNDLYSLILEGKLVVYSDEDVDVQSLYGEIEIAIKKATE